MGAHSATPTALPWYRRRWLAVPLGVWAALGATAAIAGLILAFSSAPDSYTTAATGSNISLGNGEGAQIVGTHTLTLGDTQQGCITAVHNETAPGYVGKLYANGFLAGGADDAIDLTIEVAYTDVPTGIGELFTCSAFGGWGTATTVYSGTLADFAATYTDWDTGLAIFDGSVAGSNNAMVHRFTVTLPDTNADLAEPGETALLGYTWEGR